MNGSDYLEICEAISAKCSDCAHWFKAQDGVGDFGVCKELPKHLGIMGMRSAMMDRDAGADCEAFHPSEDAITSAIADQQDAADRMAEERMWRKAEYSPARAA